MSGKPGESPCFFHSSLYTFVYGGFVRPTQLIRKLYGNLIWNIPTEDKIIYLTFDDGPDPEVTLWVLETLKKFDAKATFFCNGENVEKHRKIFEQIIAQGHAAGNHTFSHLNGWKTKKDKYLKDVETCAALVNSKLFRPPYGKLTPSQYSMIKKQYSIIMWDVLSCDFHKNITKEKCLKNVITYTKKGSIVVFHDSIKVKENLNYALPLFLEHFARQGFKFEAIRVC
ncbi:MAG: polysaccharide deacetylase family protein [Bacteroidota bacterium]